MDIKISRAKGCRATWRACACILASNIEKERGLVEFKLNSVPEPNLQWPLSRPYHFDFSIYRRWCMLLLRACTAASVLTSRWVADCFAAASCEWANFLLVFYGLSCYFAVTCYRWACQRQIFNFVFCKLFYYVSDSNNSHSRCTLSSWLLLIELID